ncbi:MAG TPA: hypothetical protein PLB62_15580 [Candidatus Sumerlaeota bacterium]|nr:hypothetical protein [Candidatus Sumerlaeota bacterium]
MKSFQEKKPLVLENITQTPRMTGLMDGKSGVRMTIFLGDLSYICDVPGYSEL